MGELRQYHPSFKILRVKELPKGDFVAISDSVQDVIILQNESKMKAALCKNVKISLAKAFQTSKEQIKSLPVKGVPTDITDIAFKEFLDLYKISHAKAEYLKSKKDGMFQLEINNPYRSRGSHFTKFNLPSKRHCIQAGRFLICSFSHVVLKLRKFQSLG